MIEIRIEEKSDVNHSIMMNQSAGAKGTANVDDSSSVEVGRPGSRFARRTVKWMMCLALGAMVLVMVVGMAVWMSMNDYEHSQAIAQTVGRKKLVWDLRETRDASVLGTPPAVLAGSSDWCWEGAFDVELLLPGDRVLKTDSLLLIARVEGDRVTSIDINGGTELSADEVREKLIGEVTLMFPSAADDAAKSIQEIEEWYENRERRGSGGATWFVRERPRAIARVRELMDQTYIIQYEISSFGQGE